MNTHDIELPPLPTPDADHYDNGTFAPVWKQGKMEVYGKQCYQAGVEADRKRWDDLEAQLEEALTDRDDYHDIADQLAEQIAAITEQEIGEHSSGNNPWKNAMLAADEWMAKDIRRLTDGVDRKRRGEPVACFKCGHPQHRGECVNVAPQPAEPVKGPSDAEIREVFLANGFTIKSGNDLKPYVYKAARALLARYGNTQEGKQ